MMTSLNVTSAAVNCFKEEWGVREGDQLRVFVRYSGGGDDAYSLGVTKSEPRYPAISVSPGNAGITLFMEETDIWYLDNRDLTIDCQGQDIVFSVQSPGP